MKNPIQKMRSLKPLDYFLLLVALINLLRGFEDLQNEKMEGGIDKITIGVLFINFVLSRVLQRKTQELADDFQRISDLKSELIDDQNEEIEALRQENAKLKGGK